MEHSHSCEAAGLQPVKVFPAVYGTRRFIITFTNSTMDPYPEPDCSSPGPSLRFLPSPSRSSTWLFYLRVPNKTPYAPLFSHIRAICRAHLVRLDLFTRVMFSAMSSVPSLYVVWCLWCHSNIIWDEKGAICVSDTDDTNTDI